MVDQLGLHGRLSPAKVVALGSHTGHLGGGLGVGRPLGESCQGIVGLVDAGVERLQLAQRVEVHATRLRRRHEHGETV